jgi:hypothetical protein
LKKKDEGDMRPHTHSQNNETKKKWKREKSNVELTSITCDSEVITELPVAAAEAAAADAAFTVAVPVKEFAA